MVRLDVGPHQLRVPCITIPGTDAASLGAVIARTRYLLLDFDGPICSIYSGLTDATVAAQLRKLIPGELPEAIASTPDPIEVFTYSATVSDELAARVEAEMADLEVAAVPTAGPTPYVLATTARRPHAGRAALPGRPVAARRAVKPKPSMTGITTERFNGRTLAVLPIGSCFVRRPTRRHPGAGLGLLSLRHLAAWVRIAAVLFSRFPVIRLCVNRSAETIALPRPLAAAVLDARF